MSQRVSQHTYQRLSAGAFTDQNFTVRVNLRDLRTKIGTAFAHLVGFHLGIRLDPTYTTAPTVAGHNKLIRKLTLNDGHKDLAIVDGNAMRLLERIEWGQPLAREALTNGGSTNPRAWSRVLMLGPLGFKDSPDGYGIPCAALLNGSLVIDGAAFTDVSADATAWTGNVYVTAILAPRRDLMLGAVYERRTFDISNDDKLTGEARYAALGLCDSSAYGAFTAGDVGVLTIEPDSSNNIFSPGLPASELGRLFNCEMRSGPLFALQGDPFDATYDVDERIVNGATPTALATAIVECQPGVWVPRGGQTSKMSVACKNHLRIATDGTNTTFRVVVGRFIPRDPGHLAFQLQALEAELKRPIKEESLKAAVLQKGSKSPESERRWMSLKLKVG